MNKRVRQQLQDWRNFGAWYVFYTKSIQGEDYDLFFVVETEEEANSPEIDALAEKEFRRVEQREFCSWGWAG